MIEIGKNNWIDGDLVIQTDYDEPTLAITISQLDSINESVTYEWKLISTYNGQVEDIIGDAIDKYHRENKEVG